MQTQTQYRNKHKQNKHKYYTGTNRIQIQINTSINIIQASTYTNIAVNQSRQRIQMQYSKKQCIKKGMKIYKQNDEIENNYRYLD